MALTAGEVWHMRNSRPRSSSPAASALTETLNTTTRAVDQAVRERAKSDKPPRPDTVCAETWQLLHLLGALGDLTTTLAPHIGSYPRHYQLRTDNDTAPAQHIAHACRELAALRHALDGGQRAAREIYTALSHLNATLPTDSRSPHSPKDAHHTPRGEKG